MTLPVNLEDFEGCFGELTFVIQSHEQRIIIIEESLPEHTIIRELQIFVFTNQLTNLRKR